MKKAIKLIGGLVAVGLLYILIMHMLIAGETDKIPSGKADYLIVLGARLYGETPSPSLVLRLDAAADYLVSNPGTFAILSGGRGEDEWISESEAMAKYLVNQGISVERLILEGDSSNTMENLENSIKVIDSIDNRENVKIVIASSKYHIYRAMLLARRQGVEAEGLPADVPPSVELVSWVREYLALGKSLVFDW